MFNKLIVTLVSIQMISMSVFAGGYGENSPVLVERPEPIHSEFSQPIGEGTEDADAVHGAYNADDPKFRSDLFLGLILAAVATPPGRAAAAAIIGKITGNGFEFKRAECVAWAANPCFLDMYARISAAKAAKTISSEQQCKELSGDLAKLLQTLTGGLPIVGLTTAIADCACEAVKF